MPTTPSNRQYPPHPLTSYPDLLHMVWSCYPVKPSVISYAAGRCLCGATAGLVSHRAVPYCIPLDHVAWCHLHHVVWCHIVPYHTISHCIMWHAVTSCHTVLYPIASCGMVSHRAVQFCIPLHHVSWCHLHHVAWCHIVPYRTVSHYIMWHGVT